MWRVSKRWRTKKEKGFSEILMEELQVKSWCFQMVEEGKKGEKEEIKEENAPHTFTWLKNNNNQTIWCGPHTVLAL